MIVKTRIPDPESDRMLVSLYEVDAVHYGGNKTEDGSLVIALINRGDKPAVDEVYLPLGGEAYALTSGGTTFERIRFEYKSGVPTWSGTGRVDRHPADQPRKVAAGKPRKQDAD